MKLDVLLGLQWGDEGKGKIVDVLTSNYDMVARFQGGPNAGHTIEFDNRKFILHTIPSGIFDPQKINVIGNGVIIDAAILDQEIKGLKEKGINASENLHISRKAHLILPTHRLLDAACEASKGKLKIGSTLKGISPTYMDKIGRNGLRVGDIFSENFREKYNKLKDSHFKTISFYDFDYADYKIDGSLFDEYEKKWFEGIEKIKSCKLINSEYYVNHALAANKRILAEGAQGSMLDIDFGSYPFVTSSNTINSGVCSGLGVSPHKVGKVYGIFKAYCTRVGAGPFPTELHDEDGDRMRDVGREYGSTTGRPRRCGWLDLVALKYSIMLNGVDELMMMKADVLSPFEELKICTAYRIDGKKTNEVPFDLSTGEIIPEYTTLKGWNVDISGLEDIDGIPKELNDYVEFIESVVNIPVRIISVGPDRKQTLRRGEASRS